MQNYKTNPNTKMNTTNRPTPFIPLLYRIQIGDHIMRITRRDLGRLAIAGAASRLAPAQDTDRPFRYWRPH